MDSSRLSSHQLLSLLFFYLRPSAFFFRFAGIALHRTVKDISQIQRLELDIRSVSFKRSPYARKCANAQAENFSIREMLFWKCGTVKELCSFLADLFRMIRIKSRIRIDLRSSLPIRNASYTSYKAPSSSLPPASLCMRSPRISACSPISGVSSCSVNGFDASSITGAYRE